MSYESTLVLKSFVKNLNLKKFTEKETTATKSSPSLFGKVSEPNV